MNQIKLTGWERAETHLAKIPIELRGDAVKKGLRNAAKQVVMVASALCPLRDYRDRDASGQPMKLRIGYKVTELRGGNGPPAVIVGPRVDQTVKTQHGHLVEFGHRLVKGGTATHVRGWTAGISASGRKRLEAEGWKSSGRKWHRGSEVMRPGGEYRGGGRVVGHVQPQAFLEPAAKYTKSYQVQALHDGIVAAVNKALTS